MAIIDEIEYEYECEWYDKEINLIAKALRDGHTLENASPGGIHPCNHNTIAERLEIYKKTKTEYSRFKLEEAEMYSKSNGPGSDYDIAWEIRKDFWLERDDDTSWFQLELARVDWLDAKLRIMGFKLCPICGLSIDSVRWDIIEVVFKEFTDILDIYKYPIIENTNKTVKVKMSEISTIYCDEYLRLKYNEASCWKHYTGEYVFKNEDGITFVCDCNKDDRTYLFINSPVRKIRSYDLNPVYQSDLERFQSLDQQFAHYKNV